MEFLRADQNVNKKVKSIKGDELDRLMSYPSENFRRVYNPCAWPIEVGVNGTKYRVKGFEIAEFETYQIHDVNHLLGKGKDYGLITLEYGAKARQETPDFNDYLNTQSIKGLKSALKHWERIKEYQKIAVHTMTAHKDPNLPKAQEIAKEIDFRIEKINEWLKQAGEQVSYTDYEEASTERPVYKPKKVKNDTSTTKSKS